MVSRIRPNHAIEPTPPDLFVGLFAVQPAVVQPAALSTTWLILISLGPDYDKIKSMNVFFTRAKLEGWALVAEIGGAAAVIMSCDLSAKADQRQYQAAPQPVSL
jgi:hypothetical protein